MWGLQTPPGAWLGGAGQPAAGLREVPLGQGNTGKPENCLKTSFPVFPSFAL